jgi:hypothetical protein
VISLDVFWVVPHVSHDGANGSVEGVPRTPPRAITLTLATESASSANAAYSQLLPLLLLLLLRPQETSPAKQPTSILGRDARHLLKGHTA